MSKGRKRSGSGHSYPPTPFGYPPSGPLPDRNGSFEFTNGDGKDEPASRIVCLTLAPVSDTAKAAANTSTEDILKRSVHKIDPITGETVPTAEWLRECVEGSLEWIIKLVRRHESFWDNTQQSWITAADDNNIIWLSFGAGYELVVLLGDAPVPKSVAKLQEVPKLGVAIAHVDEKDDNEEDIPLNERKLEDNGYAIYPKDSFWEHVENNYHQQKHTGAEDCLYSVYSTHNTRACADEATNVRIFRVHIDEDDPFEGCGVEFCGTLGAANPRKTSNADESTKTTDETAEIEDQSDKLQTSQTSKPNQSVAIIPRQQSQGKVALAAKLAADKKKDKSDKSKSSTKTSEEEPPKKKRGRPPKTMNGDDMSKPDGTTKKKKVKTPKAAAAPKPQNGIKELGSKGLEVSTADEHDNPLPASAKPTAKKRGRPPKAKAVDDKNEESDTEEKPKKKRKRKKVESDSDKPPIEDKETSSPKKKKSKATKKTPKHDAVDDISEDTPSKRERVKTDFYHEKVLRESFNQYVSDNDDNSHSSEIEERQTSKKKKRKGSKDLGRDNTANSPSPSKRKQKVPTPQENTQPDEANAEEIEVQGTSKALGGTTIAEMFSEKKTISGDWTFMEFYPREVNALRNAFKGQKKRSAETHDYSEYNARDLATAEKNAAWVSSGFGALPEDD